MDQDPSQGPDTDAADDVCMTLAFNVPAVGYKKTGEAGWGGLVLTFNRQIDGGSFIFNPICPIQTDGIIGTSPVAVKGNPTNNAIEFVPIARDSNTGKATTTPPTTQTYALQPTGNNVPVGTPISGSTKKTQEGAKYGQFVVTIMFDESAGLPQLIENNASFWQAKPGQVFKNMKANLTINRSSSLKGLEIS